VLHCDQRQKLENKNYKGICGSGAAGTSVLWVSFSRGKLSTKQTCRLLSRSSRHGTSHSPALPRAGVGFSICLHLLKPASEVATLSARARQDCQDAFVQEASWMVVGYPSFSLRIHAKLAPRASGGSSTRGSPSYRPIVALRAEASVVRVALNKNEAINHRKMHQMKFAEK
jgi:hypothetical protein